MAQVSEQQARQLVAQYQDYQRNAEMIQDQMNMVRNTLAGCESTLRTVTGLKEAATNDVESIIPVGSGCFVHAEIKNFSKVIVSVGSGANIEKDVAGALEFLNDRKGKLEKMLQDLNTSLTNIVQQMQSIEAVLNQK
ncbi:Prefoldin subunit alpha [Methanolapillus millepedarum]|uniref:Prefoldin subunit alpha n=2 Tax=Methanolapillus millepedarum TaxID=3028296 RepID=A0AA97A354_9EURY|nr:Prefoldin subunit alpha [Methanosarcinaceae archaeon Ac7]